ncbi:MAG: SCP2 sterol-binding domain-containing protein [Anaerolineales bacterium]|nr:SCP2 sterol-binding domain-containing protein [Anaerolineales bacterium]
MPTVQDIFQHMPANFDSSAAAGLNTSLQFSLSGSNGGDWTVVIANGEMAVHEGPADSPAATITMDADDFVAMTTGELNAMAAFMGGKIQVDGDLSTVMQLQSIMGM